MKEHTSSAKDPKIVAESQRIFKIIKNIGTVTAIILVVSVVIVSVYNYSTFGESEVDRQARIATEEVARQEEFLARQPKVWEEKLNETGEWYEPARRDNFKIWSEFTGACVEYEYNRQTIVVVCDVGQTARIDPSEGAIRWATGQNYNFTVETGKPINSMRLRSLSGKEVVVSFREE